MSSRSKAEKVQYTVEVHNRVESFLSKFCRASYFGSSSESASVAAARECAKILREVVDLFHQSELRLDSKSMMSLRNEGSAVEVSKSQVAGLLRHVTRTGAAMQRGPLRLLLTNVTRRVLSILREAAVQSHCSEQELERQAKELVADMIQDEEENTSDRQSDVPWAEETFDMVDMDDRMDADLEVEDSGFAVVKSPPRLGGLKSSKQQELSTMEQSANRGGKGMTSSRSVTFGSITKQGASQSRPIPVRRDDDGCGMGSKESSSLPGDLLNISPPKHFLTRAPSIVGEMDPTAVSTEYQVDFNAFVEKATAGIAEFESELENATQELSKKASRQLHDLDTVVTLGGSHSTTNFLLKAAEDGVRFKVVILEGCPLKGGARLADQLRAKGLEVRTLPDSSAFAVMSTCTKVIVGVENVLANGGLLAPIGTHPLCIAARSFSVPVIVVTMTLKMTPYYPADVNCTSLVKLSRSQAEEQPWSTYAFPGSVLPLAEQRTIVGATTPEHLVVANPLMEYVPPNLVSLFATNAGEYTVLQIHRIVRDNYNAEDSHL